MMENEKLDARDQRDGGWSWVQNELYTLFLPIVGPQAALLYQVMAMLIPKRAQDPVFDLSIRVIAKNACMSVGAVQKNLQLLDRAGMIIRKSQGPNRPALFLLTDLKKLARDGQSAIQKRVQGVHSVNSDGGEGASDADTAEGSEDAQSRSGRGDSSDAKGNASTAEAASPAASGEDTVHSVNSSPENGVVDKNLWKSDTPEDPLFTKGGVTVHEKGGNCSRGEAPLILNLSKQNLNPPLPPRGGSAVSLAASAEVVLPSLNELLLKHTPFSSAVDKVLRECGIGRSMLYEHAVAEALRTEAQRTDEPPSWNAIAERMIRAREEYSRLARSGLLRFGPFHVEKFFLGGVWRDEGQWGIDHDKVRLRSETRFGT